MWRVVRKSITSVIRSITKKKKEIFPNELTSWTWVLLEKLPVVQLIKNLPTFYGTRMFITVFTQVLHWSLSWARTIQSIPPQPISLRSILILFTHQRLGFPSGSSLLDFPPISYMHSSSPHSCYMTCPSHPPWLGHSNYACSIKRRSGFWKYE
jgi:hypothetical protein